MVEAQMFQRKRKKKKTFIVNFLNATHQSKLKYPNYQTLKI